MKKLIVGLCLFGVLFASCEKEEVKVASSLNNEQMVEPLKASNLRFYYDNGKMPGEEGVDYGCAGEGGGCLPDVSVVGVATPYSNLIRSIDEKNVLEVLNNNFDVYSDIFGSTLVNGALSGEYTLDYRGEIASGKTLFVLFVKNGIANVIYPFKF